MKKLALIFLWVFTSIQAQTTTADLAVSIVNLNPGQLGGQLEMTITNNGPDTVMPEFVLARTSPGTSIRNVNFGYACRLSNNSGAPIFATINGFYGRHGVYPSPVNSGETIICRFSFSSSSPPVTDTYEEGFTRVTVGHQTQAGETYNETNWADNTVEFSLFEPTAPFTDLELNVILDKPAPHAPGTVGEMTFEITNHGPDVYDQKIKVITSLYGETVLFFRSQEYCDLVVGGPDTPPPIYRGYSFFNFAEDSIQVNQTISCKIGYITGSVPNDYIDVEFYTSTINPNTGTYFGDLNLDNNVANITFGNSPVPKIIPSLSTLNTLILLSLILGIAFYQSRKDKFVLKLAKTTQETS